MKKYNNAFVGAGAIVVAYLIFCGIFRLVSLSGEVHDLGMRVNKLEAQTERLYRCGNQIRSFISMDEFENGKCDIITYKPIY